MIAKFQCPHCEQPLSAGPEYFGSAVPCPICNGLIHVPEIAHDEPPLLPTSSLRTTVATRPPPLPARTPPKTKQTTLIVAGIGALLLIIAAITFRGDALPETTSLRAIDAITDLPLAPTPDEAKNIEFHYNQWDRAEYAVGAGSFHTAPFRARVRILQRQPGVAYIELTDGSNSKGWVPDDWLLGSSTPIARRQGSGAKNARHEADSFLRLTRQQLETRLGRPKKVLRNSNPTDGAFDILVFDAPSGTETCFTILASDGFVSSGEYQGTPLTPYYK